MILIPVFAALIAGTAGCTYSIDIPDWSSDKKATVSEPEPELLPEPEPLPEPEQGPEDAGTISGVNIIPAADPNETDNAWGIYTESGGVASFDMSGGKITVHIAAPGRVGHGVQLYCDGFELLEGAKYRFSADIYSDVPRTIEWRVQVNGGDYHPYHDVPDIAIGPETCNITSEFVMAERSDPAPRMCFNLGDTNGAQSLGEHNVYLDNIVLEITDDSEAKKVENMDNSVDVNINQIGYRPDDEKRAVIRDSNKGDRTFEVIDPSTGETVYKGEVTPGSQLGSSGDNVCYADFSGLSKPGTYKIVTDKSGSSFEFSIADGVYDDALSSSLRMLYLQRCGCELPQELAGDFAHKACHTEEATVYGGTDKVDVSGGWHDAGDYGRYTVPAAKAVADILLAYENSPSAFNDSINIPESGNGIPDVLNEARYELEWLHKMQASDGSVYHKVTGLNFDGFVKADECTEKLYLLPASKTATADFAGVMYMAGRIYAPFDDEFAQKCIRSADKALLSYIDHINDRNFTNPKDVKTGEYADNCSVDEFLWAICEGYRTTLEDRFVSLLDMVDYSRITVDDFGWADMSGYAYYAYLASEQRMKTDLPLETRFFEMCDRYAQTALSGEAYGCTIADDYPWGSNMYIANNGMALLMAHSLTGKRDYALAAKRQLDYLFGTNSTSYCFLTGYGGLSPVNPHHRPSEAIGKCMSGMLVGGPDSALEDPYAKAVLSGLPKARCYTDNAQSYSCNEITIYWNSPLVYLLAGMK